MYCYRLKSTEQLLGCYNTLGRQVFRNWYDSIRFCDFELQNLLEFMLIGSMAIDK